jgi:hypothetical protein
MVVPGQAADFIVPRKLLCDEWELGSAFTEWAYDRATLH